MDKPASTLQALWENHIKRAVAEQTIPRERLKDGLEMANSISEDCHRRGAVMAIHVVIEYLKAEQFSPILVAPLHRLSRALLDLERGTPSPLFRPQKQGKGGRSPDSIDRDVLKMQAAVAVELFHQSGQSIEKAAKDVGEKLKDAGIRVSPKGEGANKSAERTLLGWRRQMKDGRHWLSETYNNFVAGWEENVDTPQEAAQIMLSVAIKNYRGTPK